MRWYSRVLAIAAFVACVPKVAMAQSDLCLEVSPRVPDAARAEQLRIESEEKKAREQERRPWDVKMFTVTNAIPDANLRALCIFKIEVVSQPALRLVQVRAPKELMSAIGEAMKTLDVPPPPPYVPPIRKVVELTGYILVVSEITDPSLMPLPAALQPVAAQLKNLLPNGNVYLADTIVARGSERINFIGATTLDARVSVRDSKPPIIALTNFSVRANSTIFATDVDIPVGSQIVVGKATTTDTNKKAIVLVMTAKVVE